MINLWNSKPICGNYSENTLIITVQPDEVRKLLAYFNIDENEIILRRLITEWLEENEEDEEENQWQTNFYKAPGLINRQLNIETLKVIAIFRKIGFQVTATISSIHPQKVFTGNAIQLN